MPLGDAIRQLATDAGIQLIGLPEQSHDNRRLITFQRRLSPFSMLEVLCKANGLVMLNDGDVWYIRASDDRELMGKNYPLSKRTVRRMGDQILLSLRDIMGIKDTTSPENERTPEVSLKEDESSVYVVGTRMQHTWVKGYIDVVNQVEVERQKRVVKLESEHVDTDKLGITTFAGKVTGTVGDLSVETEMAQYEAEPCLLVIYPPYKLIQNGKTTVSKPGDKKPHTITTADAR